MDLIILIGLQASGKSTFYRAYFSATHTLVSKDLMRNNKRPARHQTQMITEALQAGRSVIVDNTNPTREDRAELIQLAHQFGATVSGYYFESSLKQCLERNKQREGREKVPDIAIFTTLKKLVRPAYSEGFDQLYAVRIACENTFEVSPWEEDAATHGK
ncbi:MAG TPA: ATP-binding protein [Ktedonobacteraceae bacterium]|jgi:predicted kinase|nr:ATP-binding protein [Ktedonobacteraceae bacterium]